MGCCVKENKKAKTKNDTSKKNKTNKVEKKKNLTNHKEKKTLPIKTIDEKTQSVPLNQLSKDESNIQPEPIKTPINEIKTQAVSPLKQQTKSPSFSSPKYTMDDFINDISPADNISPVKTLSDFQTFVQQNEKPVSIIVFYGRYCPYSKRTMPGLRQWVRANQNRIFLYEADVEQASKLAEYYHVRTIPTIMAFDQNNLLIPIWQRTANSVISSDFPSSTEEPKSNDNHQFQEIFREKFDNSNNIFILLDSSTKSPNRILKVHETSNEHKQEQYLIILDNNQSMPDKSKLMLAITNENGRAEYLKTFDQSKSDHDWNSKSMASSSEQSPYIWDKSTRNIVNDSDKSLVTEEIKDYKGRMISQSSINTISQKKRPWNEQFDDNFKPNQSPSDEYPQHIHLPNCHEIFYKKQYDFTNEFHESPSSDRLSTLTYQHVKDLNNPPINRQEEICVLYLGPNRHRGFEDNLSNENNTSKLSLLTLKSHSLSE